MTRATYTSALGRATKRLAQSLQSLWPNRDHRADSERNVTFYLGAALAQAGYGIYLEASFMSINDRLDMLAMHPKSKEVLLCEAKTVFRSNGAGDVAKDFEKLRRFPLRQRHPKGYELSGPAWCLIVVSVWREEIREWWTSEKRGPSPGPTYTGAGWRELGKKLREPRLEVGSYPGRRPSGKNGDIHQQHVLYVIWKLD